MPEGNNTEISGDDVVISGISGNFPEAINIEELKEKLFDNAEFIKICEYSNWGKANLAIPKFIGRMSGHNSFDSAFFGINKKLCEDMNSMIRNMIERSYEAIVDAGLSPEDVRNTGMGVMMGSNISESESTRIRLGRHDHGYGILGHNRALIANRISYWFNVYGPSYAIQSAETSGVEVLTLAYEAIKNGHCETALVGAVAFVLHPELSYHYKGLGVLSEDGCNRSFDENAVFGYVTIPPRSLRGYWLSPLPSLQLFTALSLPGTQSTKLSRWLLSVECKKWLPCLETPFTSPHPLLQGMCRNPLCGNGFSTMTAARLAARQDESSQE
uniref:Ketosynthase family 3 (KS3) domain-containing protein n=1 Tax=Timema bartmani TaxID=61472 RepID=A0A7R9F6Y0_9NEOP|nr:unnamed protein product [Timema bartmani]